MSGSGRSSGRLNLKPVEVIHPNHFRSTKQTLSRNKLCPHRFVDKAHAARC